MATTKRQLDANLRRRRHIRTDAENLDEHLDLFLKTVMPAHYNTVRRRFVLGVFERVIKRSPVDRGFYRGSHNTSVGGPSKASAAEGKRSKAKSGAKVRKYESKRAERGVKMKGDGATRAQMGQDIWLTTNLPYSTVIEHGGYPTPVKKGSYVKKGRPDGPGWVKLSEGGYSRQAPRGVYRVSVKDEIKGFRAEMGT